MTEEHPVELAYVERNEGSILEGAMIGLRGGVADKGIAVLMFHGNTSRFYDLPYVLLGREIAALGYGFLTCNTHGHDIISPIWSGNGEMRPGGSFIERFSEVLLDLDPWISHAIAKGYRGVILMGHSFGACKVVYYQAATQDPRVLGVIAASPDVKWHAEPERVELAAAMVEVGHGEELMSPVEGNPAWYRMSARTLLERARIAHHVFHSDTGIPHVARIKCPLLAFYGTEEGWCGGLEDLNEIEEKATASRRVTTQMIEGADHVYWGKAAAAAHVVAEWADDLQAATVRLRLAKAHAARVA